MKLRPFLPSALVGKKIREVRSRVYTTSTNEYSIELLSLEFEDGTGILFKPCASETDLHVEALEVYE